MLQEHMFQAVDAAVTASEPFFAVVDRFAFGAVHACHKHNVEYAVQNSVLLVDIDGPPSHVPAPFLGVDPRSRSVFQRCLYLFYRLITRALDVDFLGEINTFRSDHGLASLATPAEVYMRKMVVTSSVFGFEYSRPVSRLIRMSGPVFPPASRKPLPKKTRAWLDHTGEKDVALLRYDSFGFAACLGSSALGRVARGLESLGFRVLWLGAECFSSPSTLVVGSVALEELPNLLAHEAVSMVVSRSTLIDVHMALGAAQPCLLIPLTPYDREVAAHAHVTGSSATMFLADLVPEEKDFDAKDEENTTASLCRSNHQTCELRQLNANASRSESGVVAPRAWPALDEVVDDLPSMRLAAQQLAPLLQERNGTLVAAFSFVEAMTLGVHDMVPVGDSYPWYSRYLLDVYAVYGGILVGLAVLLRVLWRLFWALGTWLINTLDELTKPPTGGAEGEVTSDTADAT